MLSNGFLGTLPKAEGQVYIFAMQNRLFKKNFLISVTSRFAISVTSTFTVIFSYKIESNNALSLLDIFISKLKNGFKHLLTTNSLLVEYILILIVSSITNIKFFWFLVCYFKHFQLSLTIPAIILK